MPNLIDYESKTHPSPPTPGAPLTNHQLILQATSWAVATLASTFVFALITAGCLGITQSPLSAVCMVSILLIPMALACGKSGRSILELIDRRFPNLPGPLSLLPVAAAGFLAVALFVACLIVLLKIVAYLRA